MKTVTFRALGQEADRLSGNQIVQGVVLDYLIDALQEAGVIDVRELIARLDALVSDNSSQPEMPAEEAGRLAEVLVSAQAWADDLHERWVVGRPDKMP